MSIVYKTELAKYGFNIDVDFNKNFSGFYWEAISCDSKETGRIDNYLLQKKKSFFIETSFTPEKVNVYPIRAISSTVAIEPSLILPGRWNIRFINLFSTSCTVQIFGAKQGSNEGHLLVPSMHLTESKTIELEFSTLSVLDKLFVKKDNYSSEKIIMSDFSLTKDNEILISDQSLIKPEHSSIIRKNNKIIFDSIAPIWSFFTIMFYKP